MQRLVASPCCNPKWTFPQALAVARDLGLDKFEAFTEWTDAALDVRAEPQAYRRTAVSFGIRFASMHLTSVTEDFEASLARAVAAVRFAAAIGAPVVLAKARTRPLYLRALPAILDAAEPLGVTVVIQNHKGSALNSPDDCVEVLRGVGDERLKALLEVGHFHAAGWTWDQAYESLRGRVALVHLKDIAAGRSVPFGAGEVDFHGLFAQLDADGYEGDFVVELEDECRNDLDRCLRGAVEFLRPFVNA